MGRVSERAFDRRRHYGAIWLAGASLLVGARLARTQTPSGHGVLAHLAASAVQAFDLRHDTQAARLNPNRDLYLITASDGRSDGALLDEILTDPGAGRPTLNRPIPLEEPSTQSSLDGMQSTASVLNGQSTASVLNGGGSSTTATVAGVNTAQLPLIGPLLGLVLGPVGGVVGGLLNPVLGTVLNLNIEVSGSGASVTTTSGASVLNSAPTLYY
ncbi:MAG: hypothetical protein ACRD1L_08095, partial [Terriglobales bacterium]